jgi:hypothetical protein
MAWSDYPLGTKAHAVMGGYWIKVERGWKWCNGDTFPTPGADVLRIELPDKVKENSMREIKFDVFILIKQPEDGEEQFEHNSFDELLREGFIIFKNGVLTTDNEDGWHKTIIREYTGLLDRQGKEIYEGDIVKGDAKDNFVIIPMLGGLSLLNINYLGQQHNELIAMPTNDVQTASWLHNGAVIGNIYENPELLGKGE